MEKGTEKPLLQWHPAFFAGIRIELEEEAEKLIFENEHQLGTKPKEIDVLIIKKNSSDRIRKNIGRTGSGRDKSGRDHDIFRVQEVSGKSDTASGKNMALASGKAGVRDLSYLWRRFRHAVDRHV